ncbi:MAG TPA: type II secretion system F family protein [Candidatus Nitrosotalea sp.]|nr:type II secretion system F family protein [Candidatus Nitrosotalea sp.]
MLSLESQADKEKKQSQKIERELPYFITIVSLLAASGFGPYTIFQKLKEVTLLPTIRAESIKILKRIDMLGIDPLTALYNAKDKPSSRGLGEFLSGYVSAIQSGGNVINYLKSKMESAFERYENVEKQSVEKVSGIVHAWLTMQIVILSVFILIAAIGSNPLSGSSTDTNSQPPYLLLIFAPIMSVVFMKLVQNMTSSNIQELPIKTILKFIVPPALVATVLLLTNTLSFLGINAYILGGALIAGSIVPALKFKKIYTLNLAAEAATPQILRDITEARKAGMGPEKCIIHACKRKDFKNFNTIANSVASKLEWGVPLNNMFSTLQSEIKNFQVLISFRILFEIISSGGGNINTLDSLADTSEKIYNVQKNKRESLKPYVTVGFMLIVITGFTTLLTIDSFVTINQEKNLGKSTQGDNNFASLMQFVSVAVIAQAWLAGLFIGKVTQGAYSGGFMYSIMLTAATMAAIGMIQTHVINISSIVPKS